MLVGFTCWAAFLLYPSLLSSYYFNPAPTDQALGLGFAFSLLANCLTFVTVALITSRRGTKPNNTLPTDHDTPHLPVKVRDLIALTERVLESATHSQLVKQLSVDVNRAASSGYASQALIDRVNKLLAAQVGAPSARILLGAIADTGSNSFPELVDWVEEASQSFQFNHEVLQSSVQNIEQGISVLDEKLQLLAWNDRYTELFAYPKGFLKAGMPITEILSYNAKRGLFSSFNIEPEPITIQTEINKRVNFMLDGSRHKFIRKQTNGKVIELNGAPLPGGGYVTTYSDITEYIAIQRQLENSKLELEERVAMRTAELEEAKRQAVLANESKTKFLAAAGHDLMQPFNAAALFASMLSKKTQGGELADLSKGVVNSLDNAQSILTMLLDMTKLDAGVLKVQQGVFPLNEILSSLAQEFSIIAEQKGIKLSYLPSSLFVYSDKNLLRRVVQNLLSNAVRYTSTGKIVLGVRRGACSNENIEKSKKIRIVVCDTGNGIAADEQQNIFGEFHQLDNPNSSEGIGLGLTIVERICRLLGHRISLESTLGRGSCFSIHLDLAHTSKPYNHQNIAHTSPFQLSKQSEANVNSPSAFLLGRSILLIENDAQVAAAMRSLLGDWGADVHWIKGQRDTLPSRKNFDVLIADYHLNAGEKGIECADLLTQNGFSFHFTLLITANRSHKVREEAASLGMAYLPKPVKPLALKRLLKQGLKK